MYFVCDCFFFKTEIQQYLLLVKYSHYLVFISVKTFQNNILFAKNFSQNYQNHRKKRKESQPYSYQQKLYLVSKFPFSEVKKLKI